MMQTRSIRKTVHAQKVNMGGIFLDQALPLRGLNQIDPFLLIHHLDLKVRAGVDERKVGVGPHPHRGFSPVTFVFDGGVHHRDSLGKSSIVRKGGTQYMFSGKGIVHSERPHKELTETGGQMEIIQFWVNAPSAKKMTEPNYFPLEAADAPKIKSLDGEIEVQVVSGEFAGQTGPVPFMTPILALRIEANEGGDLQIPIPDNYNALVYVLDGELSINGGEQVLGGRDLAEFAHDGQGITIHSNKPTRAILLSGEPINEQVVSYGPFVMNSQQEIMQAMQDYQEGKMGTLIEEFG